MSSGHLEVLVEPFKVDDPGPHVMAVLDILRAAGFSVEMGPFSSTAAGPLDELTAIVQSLFVAGFDNGASNIQVRIERP